MRKNKYNLIIPIGNNNYLAYNPLTNALCKIDQKIVDFLEGKKVSLSPEVIDDLVKGLFWIFDSFNESSYVDHIFYSQKYGGRNINFTIVPTLYCNMRCIYCFETTTNLNISMEPSIVEKTIVFVRKKIEEFHPAFVEISWYGGEPLLEIDTISNITQAIQKECNQRNIRYTSSLITNGTLISKLNKDLLSSLKIKSMQITIDGPREIHNLRRPFKNGVGTYDIIMGNILDIISQELNVKVNLRINVDKENEKYIPVLLTELSSSIKSWDRLRIDFGRVTSTPTLSCKSRGDTLLTTADFAHSYLRLLEEMKKLKIPLPRLYPSFNTCLLKGFTSWMIGPRGELYTCWEDVGDDNKIAGNIMTGLDLRQNRAWEWVFSNWRTTEKCSNCPIVPICLGGCPRRWEMSFDDPEGGCIYWRYILEQLLVLHAAGKKTNLVDTSI